MHLYSTPSSVIISLLKNMGITVGIMYVFHPTATMIINPKQNKNLKYNCCLYISIARHPKKGKEKIKSNAKNIASIKKINGLLKVFFVFKINPSLSQKSNYQTNQNKTGEDSISHPLSHIIIYNPVK